jgi:hypothetical protein
MNDDVWLFSYGTLQQDDVQLATFGRRLEGRADALPGYATSLFAITDSGVIATSGKTHHLMARPSGNPPTRSRAWLSASRPPSSRPRTHTRCRPTNALPSA